MYVNVIQCPNPVVNHSGPLNVINYIYITISQSLGPILAREFQHWILKQGTSLSSPALNPVDICPQNCVMQ